MYTKRTFCMTYCQDPKPIKAITMSDDESSTYVWVVFRTADIMALAEAEGCKPWEAAAYASGLYSFYRGPGKPFAHDPSVRIGKNRTVVTQFRGLDI